MNKDWSLKLFSTLSDASQVTNEEMQRAYETFVEQVENLNQAETDFQTIFRALNITRIEFKALQTQILCEQGKKCA